MTLQDRISEVERILTEWPEGDRLAGVLRVVKAMGEELDLALGTSRAVTVQSAKVVQTGSTVAQDPDALMPEPSSVVHFEGHGENQTTELPGVRCVNVTQSPAPLSDAECWRRYLLADPDGEREAARSDTGAAWKLDAIDVTRRCVLAPTLTEAVKVLREDGWHEDFVASGARAMRGEGSPVDTKALLREAAQKLEEYASSVEGSQYADEARSLASKLMEAAR